MTGPAARLFFGAWPDPEARQALHAAAQRYQRDCGGRAVPERNIHLTLAFLGDVERARLPQLAALAAGVGGAACQLLVDRVDYWRHNRILWAGVERCPEALLAVVAALARELRGLGFQLEDRPYVPHVTLLRNAQRRPADREIEGIAWPVRDFALIESARESGGRVYQVLQRWPLAT